MENTPYEPTGFVYKPLEDAEIRLLTLWPGSESTPTTCTISHVLLIDNPTYEALSYAWGEPGDERVILLEGRETKIRVNLWDALYHLRQPQNKSRGSVINMMHGPLPEATRIFWIDALYICQLDVQERNHQVALMQEIYSQADTVYAWLGLSNNDSNKLFNWIKGSCGYQYESTPSERATTYWATVAAIRQPFLALLDRDYWRRLWNIQEFCLARKLVLVCGMDRLGWEALQHWKWAYWHHKFVGVDTHFSDLLDLRTNHWQGEGHDLADILLITKRCLCTNPRDKIYGILGLISGFDSLLVVDYSRTLWQVYQDVMLYRLRSWKDKSLCVTHLSTALLQALGTELQAEAMGAVMEELMQDSL